MEKYAVEEFISGLRKQAMEQGKLVCPICGSEVLDADSKTPRCKEHGSLPFETPEELG